MCLLRLKQDLCQVSLTNMINMMYKETGTLKQTTPAMAADGGTTVGTNSKLGIVQVHTRLSDAGQFSCAALCALGLRQLFDNEIHRKFNKETLEVIVQHLEQPPQVIKSVEAIYEGHGCVDAHPFVDVLISDEILNGDASPVVFELISIAVSQGHYDARMRVLIKHVAWLLRVGWSQVEEMECIFAESLNTEKYEMSQEEKLEQQKKAKRSKYKRFALIGLATVTGGTLIGLTGGLAAPLVAAGASAIIGGVGAAAVGSTVGVAIIGSLFGVAGAGLTGYKMKKRVGAIEEFEFEPLLSGGPLQLETIKKQLHIAIAVTGWIESGMQDFRLPWRNLAESQEQYSLRWESKYLMELGQAFEYLFKSAVSVATQEALKYTVLSGILAAITWPAALLSVSNIIDNPWSVSMQRAVSAGKQLAEVLLAREQGKRPVTLIGYSLGARVIFYCLEEMSKRKGSEGIVEDVVLLGAPVSGDYKRWAHFSRVVAGRIINGYCRCDWLLKFLYRTASVQLQIAGLAPVKWDNHHMHNIDLSDVVTGHLDYKNKLDTILRVVGIHIQDRISKTSLSGHSPKPAPVSNYQDCVTPPQVIQPTIPENLLPPSVTSFSSENIKAGSSCSHICQDEAHIPNEQAIKARDTRLEHIQDEGCSHDNVDGVLSSCYQFTHEQNAGLTETSTVSSQIHQVGAFEEFVHACSSTSKSQTQSNGANGSDLFENTECLDISDKTNMKAQIFQMTSHIPHQIPLPA
ncbi:hypothetical protein C0Q70_03930 [Pomacea canaliculata]|uniref:Transmembrane and coiled-coil domain-containing protein 4 n=1 Tax=Pomacea canaliculata TaxID=400727 RepID=A0A2T7PU77_POMCA|nr:transmembrane and coiled-coil domain-containing protein 4-like isoform X2 [Pomacea canaliculata]PVD36937.1 hypothetical protein C0Q70_03930 [Pomacea canaliculata]